MRERTHRRQVVVQVGSGVAVGRGDRRAMAPGERGAARGGGCGGLFPLAEGALEVGGRRRGGGQVLPGRDIVGIAHRSRGTGLFPWRQIAGRFPREQVFGFVPRRRVVPVDLVEARHRAGARLLEIAASVNGLGGGSGGRGLPPHRIGTRQRRARGIHLVELDALDGHLALYACVPRNAHRAEAARARLPDGSVPIQYELVACHAPSLRSLRVRFRKRQANTSACTDHDSAFRLSAACSPPRSAEWTSGGTPRNQRSCFWSSWTCFRTAGPCLTAVPCLSAKTPATVKKEPVWQPLPLRSWCSVERDLAFL